MSELKNCIYTEKYRPSSFEELVSNDKSKIINYIKNIDTIPSFIFYSQSPGTGKTSTAKVIIKELGCDSLMINSSEERGIDVIRDKIGFFSKTTSSNGKKKCIFLDEADGLTGIAQDSLKNLMETYSSNVFFIFSCNNISKIIEPIVSRCISFNFQVPDKEQIKTYLSTLSLNEGLDLTNSLDSIVSSYYPDIRKMVLAVQKVKIDGELVLPKELNKVILEAVKSKSFEFIKDKVFSGELDVESCNKYLFNYFVNNIKMYGFDRVSRIVKILCEVEKSFNIGVNREVVFISGVVQLFDYI